MGIDILEIDIMGVDILGIDIPAPTPFRHRKIPWIFVKILLKGTDRMFLLKCFSLI